MISKHTDMFIMSETKLDETFRTGQFSLQGFFNTYRFDRSRSRGGFVLSIREDLSSWLAERKFRNNTEYFFAEINLRKKKLASLLLLEAS